MLAPVRSFSRTDIARLHAVGLPPEVTTEWIPRTAGLRAPPAPPEGDLRPNATGYLLAIGAVKHRLFWRISRFIPGFVSAMTAMASANLLYGRFEQVLEMHAIPSLLLLGAHRGLVQLTLHRQRQRARDLPALSDQPAGQLLRLVGTVSPQPTVPALFSGTPAVLFRNRIGQADETRGIDFEVKLDSGERLKVSVRDAFLLDPPRRYLGPPVCGPVSNDPATRDSPGRLRSDLFTMPRWWYRRFEPRLHETHVAPGDRIELCGLLDHEAAPDGQAAPGRGVPLRPVLRAGPGARLLIRKL
jgi:hypothetical protein